MFSPSRYVRPPSCEQENINHRFEEEKTILVTRFHGSVGGMTDEHEHLDEDCAVCRALTQHIHDEEPANIDPDNPIMHVSKIVKNENDIIASLRKTQDHVADVITTFAGSMRFVYIHSVWFFIWVILNAGLLGGSFVFDDYPFGLLTLIVSLEAIFLSTFVMLSQNRQANRADLRAELDYETNIRSEIWSLHIGQKLGVDAHHVEAAVTRLIKKAREQSGEPTS
jgi:uncharacterized membrane protein